MIVDCSKFACRKTMVQSALYQSLPANCYKKFAKAAHKDDKDNAYDRCVVARVVLECTNHCQSIVTCWALGLPI